MRIVCAALLAASACSSSPSTSPSATVTAATPDQLTPDDDALDDLTITVAYDDGDGDLGGGTAEIHDCRADALVTTLVVPQIASPDVVAAKSHISGTLDLHVDDVGAIAPAALPQTCTDLGVAALGANEAVFCVILVDVAGHRGDGDCTASIAIAAP
jgi:hypothetical protein